MGFFKVWADMSVAGIDDEAAIEAFLSYSVPSIEALINGEESELQAAFSVLSSVSIDKFFAVLEKNHAERPLVPSDIPCFSSFENGVIRLSELLEFEPDGLTFEEAGFQLMSSVKPGARTKYGENHSKLAAIMSLVTITNTRPALVKPTAWGTFLTKYDMSAKRDILQKLALRDACVRTVVTHALAGTTCYRELVRILSASTALRRRTNVKCLVEFVLEGTEREDALSRIDWEVSSTEA